MTRQEVDMSTTIVSGSLNIDRLNSRPVFICAGVLLVLGLLAIVLPQVATLATVLFIGWLLLIAGIGGIYVAVQGRGVFNWRSMGLLFLLTTIAGLIMVVRPDAGMRVLTAILAALFLLEGIVYTAVGIQFRQVFPAWKWMVASGVISLLLALSILFGWPASSTIVIGLLVGINFLSSGASLLMLGYAIRAHQAL